MTRRIRLFRLVAVTATSAVIGAFAVAPAVAQEPADPVIFSAHTGTLPAIEPAIGNSDALGVDPGARVALGSGIQEHTGALVRVTVTADDAHVTVFTGDADTPAPVLVAAAGRTVSTTTLLPVLNGTVPLWATGPIDARVELVAGVTGRAATYDEDDMLVRSGLPGSIITLDAPEHVADSHSGAAGGTLRPGAPAHITLTGIGAIDAQNVRANLVTVSVALSEAATFTFDGTELDLPAGDSVFTTIATPDEQGLIEATLDAGEAAFGVWVLGWVPDADGAHDTVSTGGGLEVSTDRTVQQQIEVRAGSGAPVVTDAGADVAYTVALVQSLPASELGALAVGASTPGRATGIAVDTEIGAQPQLALLPADVPAELTMSRGATLSTVTIMGEILGEPAAGDETASVSITSHREGEAVNLNAHGFLELAGLVNPGDTAIDRVEISVDVVHAPGLNAEERSQLGAGGFITYADLSASDGRTDLDWSAQIGAPVDGTYRYTATSFDRSGAQHSASVTVHITAILEDDDTVTVNSDALVVNTGEAGAPTMTRPDAAEPFVVGFDDLPDAVFPGAILVSPVAAGFPDGFLGEVVRVERRGGSWLVTTVAAEVVDAIYDAMHTSTTPMANTEEREPALTPVEEPLIVSASDPETGVPIDAVEVRDDIAGGGALVEVEPEVRATGTEKQVHYQARPGFYVIVGNGSGKENIVVTGTSGYTDEQVDRVRQRVIDQNVPGLFEAFVQVDLDLKVDITTAVDIKVKYKWKYVPVGITVNELSVNAVADTSVNAELAMNGTVKRKVQLAKPLDKVSLGDFTVWLGPIPVVFKNTITVTVDIELNLQANVHAVDIGFARRDEVGFVYEGLDSYVYLTRYGTHRLSPTIDGVEAAGTAEIAGKLDAGPTVLISSMIYGYIGPQLEFKPRVGAEGELTHTNLDPTGREVRLHVKIGGGATGRVFGQLKIWKFSLPFPSKTFLDEHVTFFDRVWTWRF